MEKEDKRKNNGGNKNAGRKPKSEEQMLAEKLSPFEEDALEALKIAVKDKKPWAIKMFFEYMYGKPHQTIQQDNTHSFDKIDMNDWK